MNRTLRVVLAALAAGSLLASLTAPAGASNASDEQEADIDARGTLYSVPTEPARCQVYGSGTSSGEICFHWVITTDDAVAAVDADANGVPDYVDSVATVFDQVWAKVIVEYGYRPPLPDDDSINHGPNRALDVYLAEIGDEGSYGSCETDDPDQATGRQVSAYCVLDNDYGTEYDPGVSGMDALRVTAAHEFFHAVQFGYDYKRVRSEAWLSEGTAVWIEDEVFDDINANYTYLVDSGLHQPEISLNAFGKIGDEEDFEYGAWVFWRFLSDYVDDPTIVREVWESVSAETRALEAIRAALEPRISVEGSNLTPAQKFSRTFGDFGAFNSAADFFYDEGAGFLQALDNRYSPTDATFILDERDASTGWRRLSIDHLASRYVEFDAWDDTLPAGARLRIDVDLPPRRTGSEARVLSFFQGGCLNGKYVKMDRRGDGRQTVDFKSGTCRDSELDVFTSYLTFTNTSWKKDDQIFKYRARVIL